MSTIAAIAKASPGKIRACTISRDLTRFGLLVEELEAQFGSDWGNLTPDEAGTWLMTEGATLDLAALVLGPEDEGDLEPALELVRRAAEAGVPLLVVARDLGAAALHRLLSEGARGFVPYPLPDGALTRALQDLRTPRATTETPEVTGSRSDRSGTVIAVHGLAGGTGATTFATNLAWELECVDARTPPRVCLLDLDLQFGAVATYLDLPLRSAVYELLSNTEEMDNDSFLQALSAVDNRLRVLTAPEEMLPLDLVTPHDIYRLIERARANFDYVVIDMPSTVTAWSDTVLHSAHIYFAVLRHDMRTIQNTLRFLRALKAEDLPVDKLRFVLNRAPGWADMAGKSRVSRMTELLDVTWGAKLPDGGKHVVDATDHGKPLAVMAKGNPLRKEIRKLARSLHDLNRSVTVAV